MVPCSCLLGLDNSFSSNATSMVREKCIKCEKKKKIVIFFKENHTASVLERSAAGLFWTFKDILAISVVLEMLGKDPN